MTVHDEKPGDLLDGCTDDVASLPERTILKNQIGFIALLSGISAIYCDVRFISWIGHPWSDCLGLALLIAACWLSMDYGYRCGRRNARVD